MEKNIGENKYHMIRYGVSGLYDYEREEESNLFDHFEMEEDNPAVSIF
jgi:hypothetical protein